MRCASGSAISRGMIASVSVSPLTGLKLDFGYELTDARSTGGGEQLIALLRTDAVGASADGNAPRRRGRGSC